MDPYRNVTSSIEGRLQVLREKSKESCQPADHFLSRATQSFSIVLRTAGAKAFEERQTSGSNTPAEPADDVPIQHHFQLGEFGATSRGQSLHKQLRASIVLAEPVLYVQSYDKVHAAAHTTAVLRGLVKLKIPDVGIASPLKLELRGYSTTEWPEAWRMRNVGKVDYHCFYHEKIKLCNPMKRSRTLPASTAIDFEMPVSSILPESINLPLGRVYYEVAVTCGNIDLCKRELKVVRMNCMCSLESAEPWIVTGQQDRVRFFFLFHGSSFRIGGAVPFTVRLSHVSDVTWHQMEIRLLEDIEYSTHNGQAVRTQSRDKGVLLRRQIGGAIRTASTAEVESISGTAKNVPMADVAVWPPNIKSLTANTLDLGTTNLQETIVMDERIDLRLPSCDRNSAECQAIHHATAYRPMYVRHYLKIILLVSRALNEASRSITYELVLKVPIHIMSCQVRETDTVLPEYRTGERGETEAEIYACHCHKRVASDSAKETQMFANHLIEALAASEGTEPPEYEQ